MAMEFIDGMSLFDHIQNKGRLSVDQAIELFTLVCDGLSHAHGKGIFHRDIKSSNLLLAKEKRKKSFDVRVIDFGVATIQLENEEKDKKSSGGYNEIVGSPAYMPPDAAMGRTYDQRSEIYSLGCTLFEALTGRPPFLGVTVLDTLRQHAEIPAPLISQVIEDEEFPDELVEIVDKCLKKDPDERYQNIDQLKEDLASLLHANKQETILDEPQKKIEWTQLKGITNIPSHTFLVITVAALAIGISIALMTVKEPRKTHKNVIEKDLPLTNLTDLIGSAVSAHFSEDKLESGLNRLRGRGDITDSDLYEIKDRKDVEELLIFGMNRANDGVTNKGVTDNGISYIVNLPVKVLMLRGTNITDKSVDSLIQIKNLRGLDISSTKITNQGLQKIVSGMHLTELKVGDKNINPESLFILSDFKGLKELEFYGVRDLPPKAFYCLSSLPDLNKFDLTSCSLEPGSLKFLEKTKVKHLSMAGTDISTRDFQSMAKLPLLSLKLIRTHLTSGDLKILSRINTLNELDLAKCYLKDSHIDNIATMKNLKTLVLRENLITEKSLAKLKLMKSLKLLDLRACPGLKNVNSKVLTASLPDCEILTVFEQDESERAFAEATDSILESSIRMRHEGQDVWEKH